MNCPWFDKSIQRMVLVVMNLLWFSRLGLVRELSSVFKQQRTIHEKGLWLAV